MNTYKTKYKVEYAKSQDRYFVYVLTETKNGLIETECFDCDHNGNFEKHEVYSQPFDDWKEAPISNLERMKMPAMYERIERELAEAIREFNLDDHNFEEPWEILKPTIRSQL